jgi:hypothetical protein
LAISTKLNVIRASAFTVGFIDFKDDRFYPYNQKLWVGMRAVAVESYIPEWDLEEGQEVNVTPRQILTFDHFCDGPRGSSCLNSAMFVHEQYSFDFLDYVHSKHNHQRDQAVSSLQLELPKGL